MPKKSAAYGPFDTSKSQGLAERAAEAIAEGGQPLGGLVREHKAQVPGAAGAPAVHRGGGDLAPVEQQSRGPAGGEPERAGVDQQRPAAVRPDDGVAG